MTSASLPLSTPPNDPPAIKPTHSETHGQVVTPWDVQGSVSADGKQSAIDYDKLIDQFGTRRIDGAVLERFERLTGHKPHIFLRRGMFFSHRYVLSILLVSSWILILKIASLTRSWIGTNRASHSFYILVGVPAAIACTWVIWFHLCSQSTSPSYLNGAAR